MKEKIGQASLEMLFNYGWMTLAVLIVVGVLYSLGVFSTLENVFQKQEQTIGTATFKIDARIEAGGKANFNLVNKGGGTVTVNYVKVNNAFLSSPSPEPPFPIAEGASFQMQGGTSLSGSVGQSFRSVPVEIGFATAYSETHVDSGVISGTYAPNTE
ncbi:hypothetical protein HY992_04835 [Candidatus Micrarchaeota archaeon]|nr:hypothetical protein [Candidatus Micrarchaeota archaeon]